MPATYTVRINGVDRAATHVLLEGFRINEITNGINTLSCEVASEDASYRPVKRQTIEVEEDYGTSPVRLIFGGVIRAARERGWGMTADGQPEILTAISADSYKTLASRRFVTESIPAGTLKAALQVLEPYLTAYGVTLDPAQANGPTLEAIEFEVVRLDDCLNFLATLSAKYGAPFTWTISYDLILGMYQTGSVAAPWNVIESDFTTTESTFGDIEVEPTDENYANKIILVGGSGKVVTTTDSFVGDGTTTDFPLKYQLVGPAIPGFGTGVGRGYVIYNGVFEALAEPGFVAPWKYDVTTNILTGRYVGASQTLTPIGVGDTLDIIYDGELKFTVIAQDAAEIAANGLWEDKILAPELEDPTLAQSVADAELARRIATGRVVRFRTRRMPAPQPGETITITVPKRAISGSFTVTDVATENDPGNVNTLYRTVTCNSNIHEQSHQTLTRWWSEKDTTGIATPAGSHAVPDLPLNSVQFNDNFAFGGAAHVLYGDLFYSQPDLFASPPEVQSKGLIFVQNADLGEPGHIGLTDPQRLEMGMIGEGDFSMDMFGIDASILVNASGNIVLTAGVPEVSPIGSPGEGLGGAVELEGNLSITEYVAALSGIQPAIQLTPQPFGDSHTRLNDLTVLEAIAGQYRTVSALPFSIQVTGTETTSEFLTYVVTAGTGTIFLPWIGSAGTPNYRSFPNTLVGRMYWIINDGGGTLTVDAGTAGTNINDASTVTLADKAAIGVKRHDDGWRIHASFGTVTGGGASGATPGGNDKDVQFNDGGALGGEDQFEWDKTTDQLTLTRASGNNSTFRVTDSTGNDSIIGIQTFGSSGVSDISFGWERVSGVETARIETPGIFYFHNDDTSPSSHIIGFDLWPGQTPGTQIDFLTAKGFYLDADGIAHLYQEQASPPGSPSAGTGMGLEIDAFTPGSGAAAYLSLQQMGGDRPYIWVDDNRVTRISDAPPQEDGSPADTSGIPVGVWAFIEEATPSGTGVVTFSSLGNYRHLKIIYNARGTQVATATGINLTFNGDTGSNYDGERVNFTTSATFAEQIGQTSVQMGVVTAASATANYAATGEILIPDYRGTTFFKTAVSSTNPVLLAQSSGNLQSRIHSGWWRSTSAITSVSLTLTSGNYVAGSSFCLYGIG